MSFHFAGSLPASKSILNRLLIIQSFAPQLQIQGDSPCDDVQHMKKALALFKSQESSGTLELDCGEAGTTLRFLALRVSRKPGSYLLKASTRLLERPQQALIDVLQQLGAQAQLKEDALYIDSQGWQLNGQAIHVDRSQSSQFASAIALSAWDLDHPLTLHWDKTQLSESYWQMTTTLLKDLGMAFDLTDGSMHIDAYSRVSKHHYIAEADSGCSHVVAALAALAGEAHIHNFPTTQLQADSDFVKYYAAMGIPITHDEKGLHVYKAEQLQPVKINLSNSPDLFPCLSVLCSLADGTSHLYGTPQLHWKESDRLHACSKLLNILQRDHEVNNDGLMIYGRSISKNDHSMEPIRFDPDHDHRMAMAAALAQKAGFPIEINNKEVVNKSFPEFWEIYNS